LKKYAGTKLESVAGSQTSSGEIISVTFLVTVNDTWYPEENNGKKCLHTVKTPPLKPNGTWNNSTKIQVGECDHGPLTYTISKQFDGMENILHCSHFNMAVLFRQ